MPLRIRTKFIGILMVAALLPLFIALVTFLWFGERYYRQSKGVLLQESAHHLSQTLSRSLKAEIELLNQWTHFSSLNTELDAILSDQTPSGASTGQEPSPKMQALQNRWNELSPDSPELKQLLQNPLAELLRSFQSQNPNFAEIFITDMQGRLIASTQKTSDYWQADEKWWQATAAMGTGSGTVDGLNFDESAMVYSIDVAIPLHREQGTQSVNIGVLKAVINASPVFSRYFASLPPDAPIYEVIQGNGQVLVSSRNPTLEPMQKRLPESVSRTVCHKEEMWALSKDDSEQLAIVCGAAPINLNASNQHDMEIRGLNPLWAVAYLPDTEVMAPVTNKLKLISMAGAALVLVFIGIGYFIASQMIIAPIRKLRVAAEAVSKTVRLEEDSSSSTHRKAAPELLQAVRAIKTNDEIEDLAHEFAFMGKRILNYQEKLEEEIHEKTRLIRKDLEFARDFQVKLMPQKYPKLENAPPAMGMNFHHVYKPASSVGGDFFDVLKLGDDKVGIFIADVMGHGVRSALITAILATLLHDNRNHADNPAEFLHHLNENFYNMIYNEGEVIFASAFYLLLDLNTQQAQFATAGHPPPLLVDRANERVEKLTNPKAYNPVLGLLADCQYETYTRTINQGDLFLMFTDGVYECCDMEGEEFGQDRLRALVEDNLHMNLQGLTKLIVKKISEYTYPGRLDDDICLVGVELFENMSAEYEEPLHTQETV